LKKKEYKECLALALYWARSWKAESKRQTRALKRRDKLISDYERELKALKENLSGSPGQEGIPIPVPVLEG
jgi:hypothetical protein